MYGGFGNPITLKGCFLTCSLGRTITKGATSSVPSPESLTMNKSQSCIEIECHLDRVSKHRDYGK